MTSMLIKRNAMLTRVWACSWPHINHHIIDHKRIDAGNAGSLGVPLREYHLKFVGIEQDNYSVLVPALHQAEGIRHGPTWACLRSGEALPA
jgi:hypothetical protein